jgi:hypothetical protein
MLKNAWYRGPFSFHHYLRNSYTWPPAAAFRAEIAPRARMLIRHSSGTSFLFCFVFQVHSSRGGVFSVGLLRENVSLLARTFLSRILTRLWVSTPPSHGAAPTGHRHMAREGGKCHFRLPPVSPHYHHHLGSITMAFYSSVLMDFHHPTGIQRKP